MGEGRWPEHKVIFFEKDNGDIPVEDFLTSLETKAAAKMAWTISLLQANGFTLREPYSKHLQDGIFELRAKSVTGITRVLYFFYVGNVIVLTNGFIKKTQKTPPSELAKAKRYREEFLKREGI